MTHAHRFVAAFAASGTVSERKRCPNRSRIRQRPSAANGGDVASWTATMLGDDPQVGHLLLGFQLLSVPFNDSRSRRRSS
jgi:hypothetical protein